MKTIRVSALRLLLLVPCLSFSGTLTINADSAYSSGAITILTNSYSPYNNHVMVFSNGITLSAFDQHTFIPETVPLFHGIALDSNSALVSAGFKKTTTANWQVDSFAYIVENYYATNDTVWNASLAFPDSLMHLDSLFDNPYGLPDSAVEGNGKWLYCGYSVPLYSDQNFDIHIMKGYNNVIYVSSAANKMKLQVSRVYWGFVGAPGTPFLRVDSMRLFWAVDSFGDGIFRSFSSIKEGPPPSPKARKRIFSSCNFKTLHDLINSGLNAELYTPTGRLIGRTGDALKSLNVNALPSGILLYRIKPLNQSAVWGKVLTR